MLNADCLLGFNGLIWTCNGKSETLWELCADNNLTADSVVTELRSAVRLS